MPTEITIYTAEDLVKRAVRNAVPHKTEPSCWFGAIMDTFGVGSTMAREICKAHGLDPDEKVDGVHCSACNP